MAVVRTAARTRQPATTYSNADAQWPSPLLKKVSTRENEYIACVDGVRGRETGSVLVRDPLTASLCFVPSLGLEPAAFSLTPSISQSRYLFLSLLRTEQCRSTHSSSFVSFSLSLFLARHLIWHTKRIRCSSKATLIALADTLKSSTTTYRSYQCSPVSIVRYTFVPHFSARS